MIGFAVYRDRVRLSASTTVNYSDTGLVPATAYAYTITAGDATGNESRPSPEVTGTNITDTIVPIRLTATVTSDSEITVTWNASGDNVNVTTYRIFEDSIEIGSPTGTALFDTGLSPETPYSYAVIAHDAAGNESAQSTTAIATIPDTTAPSVPGRLTATAAGANSIDLSRITASDDVAVTTYVVRRDGVQVRTSTSTSFKGIRHTP